MEEQGRPTSEILLESANNFHTRVIMYSHLLPTGTHRYSMNPSLSHATWSDDPKSFTHKWGELVNAAKLWFAHQNHNDRVEAYVLFYLRAFSRKVTQVSSIVTSHLSLVLHLACLSCMVFFSFTFLWEFPYYGTFLPGLDFAYTKWCVYQCGEPHSHSVVL